MPANPLAPAPYPPTEFIAVFADGDHDATVYSDAEAVAHARELKRMGFTVTRKAFASESELYAYVERKRGR